jgi:hypothetical protein
MTTHGRNGGATGGNAERDPRLDRLYREVPREEPPARLDAAILAAAHREAGARPRPHSARLHAWRVPVSIAAVVMLSVSLVTLVREEGGDKLDSSAPHSMDSRTAPAPQAPLEAARVPDRARPAQPAPDAIGAQEQAKPAPPAAREDTASANTAAAKAAEETARRSAAASALLSEEAARRSTGSVAGLSSVAPEARAPVPAPAPPAPQPFREAPATGEQRPPVPSDMAAGAIVARPSPGMRGSSETESSAVAGESKAQAEPTERMAQRDQAMAGNPAGSSSMDRSLAAPAPAAKPEAVQRPEPRMLAKRAQAGPGRITPLIKELDSQPAAKWLEKIKTLRREGRKDDADDLLVEFKRRFPDEPLPPALR